MRRRRFEVGGRLALTMVVIGSCVGCATPSRNRAWVADELERRVGHRIAPAGDEQRPSAPPGVSLADGLNEDEAVALALWNSPAFAADLSRLQVAIADFDEAARIDNPRISVLGPIGPITAAASLVAPIMSLFQLPQRSEAASRNLESVAASLVQSGLDLARDVRVAHIDAALAGVRVRVNQDLAGATDEFASLAAVRSASGDASPADALASKAESLIAADNTAAAQRDLALANARLMVLLGRDAATQLRVSQTRGLPGVAPPMADLLEVSRAARPDVQAAETELLAAAERAGWERSRIVALSLQVDVQWDNSTVAARVGGVVDIPIFNQNQGGVGRADAAVERARHRLLAVRQQVTLDVLSAHRQLDTALASERRYAVEVVPALEGTLHAARVRYKLGEDSYIVVLDALRGLGRAQLRVAEVKAEVRRAHANLERAAGARLEMAPAATERK